MGKATLTLIRQNQTHAHNFTTSIIFAHDGSEYALVVDNQATLNNWYSANSGGQNSIFDANGNYSLGTNEVFPKGSTLHDAYYDASLKYRISLDGNTAHDYAMVEALKGLGVSLLKKEKNSQDFKQLRSQKKTDTKGKVTYINTNCN